MKIHEIQKARMNLTALLILCTGVNDDDIGINLDPGVSKNQHLEPAEGNAGNHNQCLRSFRVLRSGNR